MNLLETEIKTELNQIHLSRNRYAFVLQFLVLIFSVWYQAQFNHHFSSFILALGGSGCLLRVFATEIIQDDKDASSVFQWLGFFLLSAAWVFHIDQALSLSEYDSESVRLLNFIVVGLILSNIALLVADIISYYVFLIPICIGLVAEVYFLGQFQSSFSLANFLMLSFFASLSLHYQHRQLREFISARLEANQERSRLRYLIDNVPGFVVMVDASGAYFDANQLVTNRFPTIVGSRIGDFVMGDFTERLSNFIHSEKVRETIETKMESSGETHHLMSTFSRLDNGGTISISIPIGELVETRKELREKEAIAKYSAKLATIGQMAAGVAHEVNNPLAIIQGSASIIADLVEEDPIDRENLKLFSKKIITTTQRISQIVRSLRSLSRGGEKDPFEPLSLNNLVSSCLDISNHELKQLSINVILPDKKKDFMVLGREVELGQVLLNLLSNAIGAIKSSSERWVKFDYGHSDGHVWIEVSDSGKGIDPVVASKMMEAFFTTKEKNQGTGLGLSISLRIIEEHGGKLTYESDRQNTTFRILFPSPKL